MLQGMPVERADDHPTSEMGEVRITSFAAPARGSAETALFRADLPAGAGLPPHRHDHFDVFTVTRGTATFHLGEESFALEEGDSAVVPTGELHWLDAGPGGCAIVVTMLPGTLFIREEDGVERTPPWVS
jgi:quercetin dioxygenase-like cupin family protein